MVQGAYQGEQHLEPDIGVNVVSARRRRQRYMCARLRTIGSTGAAPWPGASLGADQVPCLPALPRTFFLSASGRLVPGTHWAESSARTWIRRTWRTCTTCCGRAPPHGSRACPWRWRRRARKIRRTGRARSRRARRLRCGRAACWCAPMRPPNTTVSDSPRRAVACVWARSRRTARNMHNMRVPRAQGQTSERGDGRAAA